MSDPEVAMTEVATTELSALALSGSHLGRTATIAFGTERHPHGLIRGRLDGVKHDADLDDIELSLAVGGQTVSMYVGKDETIELE
jgi:hypothetical protein